jgi:polyketide biosynthesis enoyl-CoA hydratase PksI
VDLVTTDRPEDGIAVLRLNDPRRENRLSVKLCAEWSAALDLFAADQSIRTLVIAGLSGVFCAGSAIDELRQISVGQLDVHDSSLPLKLVEFPVPVVAAMEGHAVGGGLALALLCDLVVAASDRRYGMNFTELGLTPGVGTTRIVTDLVGYHLAAELLFAGRFHRGDELARRGLFNVAVDSADVLSSAFDLARQISTKPRKVLEMTKAAMALGRRTALLEAMSREHLMHQVCHNLPETVASIESNYLQGKGR